MLEVKGINVYYDTAQVLHNVTIRVEKGEIVSLVGSNGSGKSTLLRTIIGAMHPQYGQIQFQGKEISRFRPHDVAKLGIGYVPEGRRLFPFMTVKENLEMGGFNATQDSKQKNYELAFELFPILRGRIKQEASTLSGGEQQMLAIARSLMANPSLLVLDEPSLGLAPMVVKEVFETIKELNREHEVTIFLVEQNTKQSLAISNRCYALENGSIVIEGKGEELLNNDSIRKAYLGI